MQNKLTKLDYLEKHSLSIYIEKDGKIVFQSVDPMLKPLFICLVTQQEILKQATVVDKVIGRAAALLAILGEVAEIITPLASESAEKALAQAGIPLYARKIIPYIVNRDRSGLCPMEQMAGECKTPAEFFERLKAVIKIADSPS